MKALFLLAGVFGHVALVAQHDQDSTAIVQLLKKDYATLENYDFTTHRSLITDEYYLIENGELWDIPAEKEYYRSNSHRKIKRENDFDIHAVRVYGDIAYAIYTLQSEITENGAMRGRRWMESAILRRIGSEWRIEVLHSTRIDLKK